MKIEKYVEKTNQQTGNNVFLLRKLLSHFCIVNQNYLQPLIPDAHE